MFFFSQFGAVGSLCISQVSPFLGSSLLAFNILLTDENEDLKY